MAKEKKQPKDYPQFYCRMNSTDKEEIEDLIEEIREYELENHQENELLPKRNDIIVRALKRGLKRILAEKSK